MTAARASTREAPTSHHHRQEAADLPSGYNGHRTDTGMDAVRARLPQLLHQIDLDEQLRVRAVQQAIAEATAEQWRRRAQDFERVGNERCDQVALACRRKAAFLEWEAGHPLIDPAVVA